MLQTNGTAQNIKIKFSTHTQLDSVSVTLFVEDKSKFEISENSVSLKEGNFLSPISDGSNIINFQKGNLTDREYTFETSVDLSGYPQGTCFVLFGSASGKSDHAQGIDSSGIYFCK